MRTRREPETDEQRDERLAREAQDRRANMAAEEEAVHTLVKRSIDLHGA